MSHVQSVPASPVLHKSTQSPDAAKKRRHTVLNLSLLVLTGSEGFSVSSFCAKDCQPSLTKFTTYGMALFLRSSRCSESGLRAGGCVSQVQSDPASPLLHKSWQISRGC